MVTYQDLLKVGQTDADKMYFVRSSINQYKSSDFYKMALIADQYDRRENPDIQKFRKTVYTVTGRTVPDTYSSDYRIGRAFFPFFITQEVQYLLSNGVTWEDAGTADRLGTKSAQFDTRLQDAAHAAVSAGCSYGFWNYDHIDVFTALEFVPLYDEENGALRSGIRFWQIDASKPFRATLYEEDGYTEYIWNRDKNGEEKDGEILREKTAYIAVEAGAPVDADKIYKGENYPSFPIVPMFGNKRHQSELVGIREQIFVYDMIRSGFCNSVEDASFLFWSISNAPGMDEEDMAAFLQTVRRVHVAKTEDGNSKAEPHQIETPYQSREALLTRLEKDIYKDAMAFDSEQVAGGAVTATQIKAAYENLEQKTNDFEYCVIQFINGILELAGIEDNPTFTRARNINVSEEIQTVMSAATALDEEYVTKKILTLLGDADQIEDVLNRKINDEVTMQRGLQAVAREQFGNPEQSEEVELNG